MDVKVNTSQGWTEVIIDDDCGLVKFYRVADILADDFNFQFTRELDHLDTSYKDFIFKGSELTLHYNVYLGISIFPIALKTSTASDNERVLEIGQLLFDKVIDLDWEPFEDGSTVGQPGSEGGQTLIDLEHLSGARITLEKDCAIAPFAITLGIYGLMMHTHFESEPGKAMVYFSQSKFKINKIIDLYDTKQERRSEYWDEKREKMINELAEIYYTENSEPQEIISRAS